MMERERVLVAVLAAGSASRMGASKLTMPFAGTTLLNLALEAALGSSANEVAVVTGFHRDDVSRTCVRYPRAREAHNPDAAEGQASSVRCAVRTCKELGCEALVVCVADQPLAGSREIDALIGAWRRGLDTQESLGYAARPHTSTASIYAESPIFSEGAANGTRLCAADGGASGTRKSSAVRPWAYLTECGGRVGSPCLFTSACFHDLLTLSGDTGARALFRAWETARVARIAAASPQVFEDADDPTAFMKLEALYSRESLLRSASSASSSSVIDASESSMPYASASAYA